MEFKEGEAAQAPTGYMGGKSTMNLPSYFGPCPPKGVKPHPYVFTLMAYDLAPDAVPQQLDALANGGERRLQFVRDMTQEPRLLLFELVQARAQPLEALPEVAHILRPVHLDRVSEVGGRHLANRLVELADGHVVYAESS